MIVDDDPHILKMVRRTICKMGFDALEAGSVTEAVDVLTNHGRISLVISDIQMPGGSGVDLFNRMKSDRNWASIPIVLMTGCPLPNLPAEVLILAKPFGNLQFRCVLVAHLGGACPKATQDGVHNQLGACRPASCNIFLGA